MMNFLAPYLTQIKIALLIAALTSIGGLYFGMSHYKALNKVLSAQVAEAQNANAENVKTINEMQQDAGRAEKLCNARLAIKEKTIVALRKTGALSEGGLTNAGDTISSGNSMLDALNGMYPKAGYQGGICKAEGPGASAGDPGQSGNVLYCFSARQDVLNYLANKALHDGREAEMESMLRSFQTGTGG